MEKVQINLYTFHAFILKPIFFSESSCKTEIKPMLEITRQQSVVTSQQKQPIKQVDSIVALWNTCAEKYINLFNMLQVKPEVSSAVITPGTLKMEMSKETSAGSGSSSRMSSVTATSGRGSSMVHPVQASVTNKPDINSLVYSQGTLATHFNVSFVFFCSII